MLVETAVTNPRGSFPQAVLQLAVEAVEEVEAEAMTPIMVMTLVMATAMAAMSVPTMAAEVAMAAVVEVIRSAGRGTALDGQLRAEMRR